MSRRRALESAPSYRPGSSGPQPPRAGDRLGSADDVHRACADIRDAQQEHFVVFDLDTRHRIIARRVVGIGTICGVEVHPREVFRQAIINGASAVVMAHNHPSEDPAPSREDIDLTRRLVKVGELVGITILDHVVVAGGVWASIIKTPGGV